MNHTMICPHCGGVVKLYNTKAAAEYLANALGWKEPVASLKYHIYTTGNIEGQLVGHTLLFSKGVLDGFVANHKKKGEK